MFLFTEYNKTLSLNGVNYDGYRVTPADLQAHLAWQTTLAARGANFRCAAEGSRLAACKCGRPGQHCPRSKPDQDPSCPCLHSSSAMPSGGLGWRRPTTAPSLSPPLLQCKTRLDHPFNADGIWSALADTQNTVKATLLKIDDRGETWGGACMPAMRGFAQRESNTRASLARPSAPKR